MGKNDLEELTANLQKVQRGIDKTMKNVDAQSAVADEIKRQFDVFSSALKSLLELIDKSDKKRRP